MEKDSVKTSGGFGLFGVILVIAVVVLASGGGLYYRNQQPTTDNPQQATDDKSVTANELTTDTSGWKTYRNEQYGFEIEYPKNIVLKKDIKRECAVGMGPAQFKTTTLRAGVPLPVVFRSHIEEEVLFAGSIYHQSSECLNIQLPLVSFHIISKPKNFTDLEDYVNNEKIKAEAFERKWPSAAGQEFSIKQEMIGNAKAFVLVSSDFSVRKNTQETTYLEYGSRIYYMGFDYAAEVGIGQYRGPVDDNLVLFYQTAQKVIKTFKFLK